METKSASKRKATLETSGVQKIKLEGKDTETPKKHKFPNRTKNKIINIELQEPTNYLDTLPDVALRVLYKYLPVEDTLNTFSVTSRMKAFATEKSIWKDKILYISDVHMLRKYRWIIRHSPLLSAVRFSIEYVPHNHDIFYNFIHSVVHILEHMNDLHYLNAGHIQFNFFSTLFEKFENLQRVEVRVNFIELPFLLEDLKYCTKLRELNLNFSMVPVRPASEHWKNKITRHLTYSFPSLTNIDLSILQEFLEIEDMVQILERKKDKLLNLKFILDKTALLQLLDVISSCVRLNLDLTVTTNVRFKLDQLKLLKSLKLTMKFSENNVTELNNVFSGIPMPNVKILQVFCFHPRYFTREGLLGKLIVKFPKLQELDLIRSHFEDIDEQLSNICNLTELKCLKLFALFLTYHGVSHLTQCKSLKELHLACIKLNKDAVNFFSKCIKLERLTITGKLSKQFCHSIKTVCCERNITLNLTV